MLYSILLIIAEDFKHANICSIFFCFFSLLLFGYRVIIKGIRAPLFGFYVSNLFISFKLYVSFYRQIIIDMVAGAIKA